MKVDINKLAPDFGQTLNQILSQLEGLVGEPAKPEAKPDDPSSFLALLGLEDRKPASEKGTSGDTAQMHW